MPDPTSAVQSSDEESAPGSELEERGSQPLRTSLGISAEKFYTDERITAFLERVTSSEKQVRFSCKHCNKVNLQPVPDDIKQTEAFIKLAEFLEGRASTVDAEIGGLTIVVERIWPSEEPEGHQLLRPAPDQTAG